MHVFGGDLDGVGPVGTLRAVVKLGAHVVLQGTKLLDPNTSRSRNAPGYPPKRMWSFSSTMPEKEGGHESDRPSPRTP